MKKNVLRILKMAAYYSFLCVVLQGFVAHLLFATPLMSQNLHNTKISTLIENVTLEEAFKQIEQKTNYKFFYIKDEIPVDAKVTIDADNESLYNVLQEIAGECNLSFATINNQIIVKKVEVSEPPAAVQQKDGSIKGKIIYADSKEPVAGANVMLMGTQLGAATDAEGNYELRKIPAGEYTIEISCVGCQQVNDKVNILEGKTLELNYELKEASVNLSEVVVTTSTVLPTTVKKLPNTISIVTTKDIEKINPTDVADLVRLTVPGAIYSDEGAGTTYGSFSVRGVSSVNGAASNMKVYVDGVQVSDPAYITYMDPEIIDRVEVVPGPQASTIYGAGAISGVMQIFTKKGGGGKTTLSGNFGVKTVDNKYVGDSTPLGQESSLNLAGGYKSVGYNFGVNYENEPQWTDLFIENALNLSGATNISLGKLSGNLSANYSRRNKDNGIDPFYTKLYNALGQDYTPSDRTSQTQFMTYALSLGYKAADVWTHNFTFGYNVFSNFLHDRKANTSGQYLVSDSDTERLTAAYNTSYQLQLNDLFESAITLGADWTQYSRPGFSGYVSDYKNGDYEKTNSGYVINSGFFAQTQLSYNDFLFFTAGLRGDKRPSGAENSLTWSPRLGLSAVYEVEEWMVKGRVAWGQSVVIPSASYITGSESAYAIFLPNQDLKSEVQKGYEFGVDLYYSDIMSLDITYYTQKPTNLIESVSLGTDPDDGRSIYQYQNLDEVKNEGYEIKLVTQPKDWLSVNLNYGSTKSTITKLGESSSYSGTREVGDKLEGKPEYTLSMNVEVTPVEGTSITLSAFRFGNWEERDFDVYYYDIYGGTYDPNKDYYITYPTYTRIDLNISQKITDTFNGYLQIKNLANTDRVERVNLIITQPRTIVLGVKFSGIHI